MAAKRKNAPPPPPAAARSTTSDDEDSESDEGDQFIAKPNPTKAKTPNNDGGKTDSGSESESDSESDKSRPTKPLAALQQPSESESDDSSSEDEEEDGGGAKEEKKPKSPPPPKPSEEADQPPSTNKSPMAQRIWSSEDEMTLLKALSDYKAKNGKLPPKQEYSTFLSTISSSIGFPVAQNQLYNKIRTLRTNYTQKKKKGSAVTFQQPRDVIVYRICKELFEEGGESSKGGAAEEPGAAVGKKDRKRGKVEVSGSGLKEANGGSASAAAADGKKNRKKGKVEVNGSGLEEANGGTASVAADGGKKDRKKGKVEVSGSGLGQANGGAASVGADVDKKNSKKRKVEVSELGLEEANGGTSVGADVDNNGDGARCHVYLADLIRNMHAQQSLGWLSPDDVMARIEESKLQDLEAKAKKLKIKEIKLHVGKAQLVGEMLDLVADAMEHD